MRGWIEARGGQRRGTGPGERAGGKAGLLMNKGGGGREAGGRGAGGRGTLKDGE